MPRRPAPGAPGPGLLAALAGVAVLAGLGVAATPAGASWTVTGWAMLAVGAVVVRRRGVARRGGTAVDRGLRRLLVVLAGLLLLVPSVTASGWLIALCLLGAFGVCVAAVTDARSWRSMLLVVPTLPYDAVLAVPWLSAGVPRGAGSWLRTVALSVVSVWAVAALLASGDPAFRAALDRLLPPIDLGSLPGRVVVGLFFAGLLAVLLRAGLRASRTPDEPRPVRRRPVQEWAVPLAAVDAVLVAFFVLQAYVLFGGHDVVAAQGVTYAERAREGFGQLAAVTALTLALIAWAAARCDATLVRDRLVRDVLAGALVGLSLLLLASALQRMWLYEEAYGHTVTRYVVVVVELLIGVLFLLVAAARQAAVARLLPRLVVAACAVALLVLGFSRPDAVVAGLDVERFARTGVVDLDYLSRLSVDAVPALTRLPEPARACAFVQRRAEAGTRPWYAANLSVRQARSAVGTVIAGASGTIGLPDCTALLDDGTSVR